MVSTEKMTTSPNWRTLVVKGFIVVGHKSDEPVEKAKPISRLFHARAAAEAFSDQAMKSGLFGGAWVTEKQGFDDIP